MHQTYEQERKQAIAKLVELGIAQYVNDLDLYHGRAATGEQWKVDPNFENGGNKTGNHNVNGRDGLYACDKNTAIEFANARAKEKNSTPELYKIVSQNDDDIIIDLIALSKKPLSAEQQITFSKAMWVLNKPHITELTPIKFEYQAAMDYVQKELTQHHSPLHPETIFYSEQGIEDAIQNLKRNQDIRMIFGYNVNKELSQLVYNLAESINTANCITNYDNFKSIIQLYIANKNFDTTQDPNRNIYFNHEFFGAWCAANHIIGTKDYVKSATIHKSITAYHFFDKKKIMTAEQKKLLEAKQQERYGAITASLTGLMDQDKLDFFQNANAGEVMSYMKRDQDCAELYDKSCHIWEGWNVGQHTQATINFFDDYYKEDVPTELRPFIKTCLLAHDIGKGHAAEQNRPQTEMNLKYASKVYDYLQIPNQYRGLINFIIGKSQSFTTDILKNKGDTYTTQKRLYNACNEAFVQAFQREPLRTEVAALSNICSVIQECDSGSYTRYAKVFNGKYIITGGNDRFTQSFELNDRNNPHIKVLNEGPEFEK